MKRILVAHSYQHRPEITKRFAPETWEDHNYKEEETRKEEEERIFNEIKRHLKKETSNITVIKKQNTLGVAQILYDQFLYEPFVQVVHLVETPSGIVPVEGDCREATFFRNTRVAKRSKYTFGQEITNSFTNEPEMKILSSIYAVEGVNVKSVYKYLEGTVALKKRLEILDKILKIGHSLKRRVIDPLSIFISEIRTIDVIYIPTERINISSTEYMMFVLSVLLDTYTVMEKAIIVREMTMGVKGRIRDEIYQILRLVYELVSEKEDITQIYTKLSEYITNCMKSKSI